jgi:hypothetical protein
MHKMAFHRGRALSIIRCTLRSSLSQAARQDAVGFDGEEKSSGGQRQAITILMQCDADSMLWAVHTPGQPHAFRSPEKALKLMSAGDR